MILVDLETTLRGNPLMSNGVDKTGNGWVEPDSFATNTAQPTGRRRRAGGRPTVKRIPDGTVHWRDNQWGIPRKRALFASDGPDSTTSGSDILEGHYQRPPEDGYSDIPNSGQPDDVHFEEELCSPSRQLEESVVRLQQDIADYRTELRLNRTQTPAISTRPPKRSGFTSTPQLPDFTFEWLGRHHSSSAAAFSPGRGCPQHSSTGPEVSAGAAGTFGEIIVGPLQFSRAVSRIQASVSEGFPAPG